MAAADLYGPGQVGGGVWLQQTCMGTQPDVCVGGMAAADLYGPGQVGGGGIAAADLYGDAAR